MINVVKANGERQLLDVAALKALIKSACAGLEADTDAEHILSETLKNLYDGVAEDEVNKSAIMAARAMIEKDPSYNLVTSRLLLNSIRLEILGEAVSQKTWPSVTPNTSPAISSAALPPSCWTKTGRI